MTQDHTIFYSLSHYTLYTPYSVYALDLQVMAISAFGAGRLAVWGLNLPAVSWSFLPLHSSYRNQPQCPRWGSHLCASGASSAFAYFLFAYWRLLILFLFT